MAALEVSLKNASKVFNACCILHNWCVTERILNENDTGIIKKVYQMERVC